MVLARLGAGMDVAEVDREGRILSRGAHPMQCDLPVLCLAGTNFEAGLASLQVKKLLKDLSGLPEGEKDVVAVLSSVSMGNEVEGYPRKPVTRLSLGAAPDLAQWRRARYALLYAQEKKMTPRRIDLRTDPVKYVL